MPWKIKKIDEGRAFISEWVDGCWDCAVNLRTGSLESFITVDGVGEWCKVRDCTEEEKAEIAASIPQFLAEQSAAADCKAKAIAKARAIGLSEEEMPDYLIPAYWADRTKKEILAEYCREMED